MYLCSGTYVSELVGSISCRISSATRDEAKLAVKFLKLRGCPSITVRNKETGECRVIKAPDYSWE